MAGCATTTTWSPSAGHRTSPRSSATSARAPAFTSQQQGTYRYRLTRDQLLDAGLPPGDARLNAGVLTWTLRDGEWRSEHEPDFPEATRITGTTCAGWYDVRGDTVIFTTTQEVEGGTCAPPSCAARWTLEGDTVFWSDVTVSDFAPVFSPDGWQKIA